MTNFLFFCNILEVVLRMNFLKPHQKVKMQNQLHEKKETTNNKSGSMLLLAVLMYVID